MSQAFTLTVSPEGVAELKFDLPNEKVNKFTPEILAELDQILDKAAQNSSIKLLKLSSGKEQVFIAGADLHSFEPVFEKPDMAKQIIEKGHSTFDKLAALPFPTVAIIQGPCLGGGLECALSCTYRLVSDHPKTNLGLPETQLGIIPGWGGTQRLPRLVGLQKALEMILGGKTLNAVKAYKAKLADAIAPWEFLDQYVDRFVNKLLNDSEAKKIQAKRKEKPWMQKLLEDNPVGRALVYFLSEKAVKDKTKGRYPAPEIALKLIKETYTLPLNEGLKKELNMFLKEIPTGFFLAKDLIRLFFTQEALKKETGAPPGTPVRNIREAAIIGAGTMGSSLGWLFADKEIMTRMKDISWEIVGKGMAMARAQFKKGLKARKLTCSQCDLRFQLLNGTVDYTGFQHVDFVLEAATENLDLKRQLFAEIEGQVKKETIIASNTSSLTIDAMAESLKYPERFVGMHFFNPVAKMPLVEVVAGKHTSPETVATTVALCRKLGKTPVVVKDCPGFLVNRIFLPGANEALRMLEEGYSMDELNSALLQFGMPMGPFILADEVGNDVVQKVGEVFERAYGERMHPPMLGKLLVENKLYGKKSGKGFYIYEGEKMRVNPQIAVLIDGLNLKTPEHPKEEILPRFLYAMINEAARCLDEKIIEKASYLDLSLIMGMGFPPFQGGLLAYADRIGSQKIVETLDRFKEKLGMRFEPCNLLRKMAQHNDKFLQS
ncbi:MAG: 3-hydroxyacyl-CoA dehydrogenase NAD-binding domain-containing protein [Parachlamydiaceae bacterium]